MSTTTRLLGLLSLLQTQRDWPGMRLAARLDVSDRTIRRDIERLREMGYRIHATKGTDGGYRLEAGSELPPLLFDEAQAVAIAIALQTVAVSGVGIEEAAVRALATIRQVMPSRLRHRLDSLEVIAMASTPGQSPPIRVSTEVLIELGNAIRDQVVLRFDFAPRGERSDDDYPARRVEPHHLVSAQGRWYLVAWDLDRADWRIFGVDRIAPRTPVGPRFAPRAVPGGDVDLFVAARFRGTEANSWPCRGAVILDRPLAEILPFIGDGSARPFGDDRSVVERGSWSWIALAASFGQFDAPMEVLGPPELASAFVELAGRYSAPQAHTHTHPAGGIGDGPT